MVWTLNQPQREIRKSCHLFDPKRKRKGTLESVEKIRFLLSSERECESLGFNKKKFFSTSRVLSFSLPDVSFFIIPWSLRRTMTSKNRTNKTLPWDIKQCCLGYWSMTHEHRRVEIKIVLNFNLSEQRFFAYRNWWNQKRTRDGLKEFMRGRHVDLFNAIGWQRFGNHIKIQDKETVRVSNHAEVLNLSLWFCLPIQCDVVWRAERVYLRSELNWTWIVSFANYLNLLLLSNTWQWHISWRMASTIVCRTPTWKLNRSAFHFERRNQYFICITSWYLLTIRNEVSIVLSLLLTYICVPLK